MQHPSSLYSWLGHFAFEQGYTVLDKQRLQSLKAYLNEENSTAVKAKRRGTSLVQAYLSPKRKATGKSKPVFCAETLPMCPECHAEMVEDRSEGLHVCMDCGLCERMIIPDGYDYVDVDWTGSSVVQKSQYVPIKYALDITRKFNLSEQLIPEVEARQ